MVIPPHQPQQPGNSGRRMPTQPKPVDPGHRIDPSRNGDGRSVDQGRFGGRPEQGRGGRVIAPPSQHVGRIDRDDVRRNIGDVQRNWDRNNHGYDEHDWNGMRVRHHYDEFGFHWWGFFIGESYFWTRYYDENYWWYDPYWHRWCYLHEGQWWWQNDARVIYVYTPDGYYQYDDSDSGVIMTPDPTPPVDVPPGDSSSASNETAVYSLDGTRSVKISGDNQDAYLYDLTVVDPEDPKAAPRWLASGVTKADFLADADGALQQINLSFADANETASVDVNGERKVDVSGDSQSAYLYNLADSSVDPVLLASGVTGVQLSNGQTTDDAGNTTTSLSMITLTSDDGQGDVTTLVFDRDGLSVDGSAQPTEGITGSPATPISFRAAPAAATANTADSIKSLQERMRANAALQALQSGALGW